MSSTEQKLEQARERNRVAQDRADYLYRHTGVPDDPGAVSGIRRKSTPRQVARSAALTDRALDAYKEAERTRKAVERLEAKLRHEQKEAEANAAATVDLARLKPGDLIRYRSHGHSVGNWLRVKRVNRTTVTCQESGPGMDPPRIPHDRIVETRHQEDT
ncbi:hypothetical protein [Nesterenkonia suensis]